MAQVEQKSSWRRYEPGASITDYQDASDDVFFIVAGRARVTIYSLAEKTVSFNELGPGEVFGEYPAIDGGQRSASVESTHKLCGRVDVVFRVPSLLQSEPAVATALLRQLVATVCRLTTRVYEFSTLAVNNRIHAEILRLANLASREGEVTRIVPAPTHLEIASRVSAHRGDRASVKSCGEDPSAGFNIPPLADRNTPTSSKRRFSRGRHPF